MSWATVAALLLGAGITLVTAFATTIGAELFRESRAKKQQRAAEQRLAIECLIEAVTRIATTLERGRDRIMSYGGRHEVPEEQLWELLDSLQRDRYATIALAARMDDPRVDNLVYKLAAELEAVAFDRDDPEAVAEAMRIGSATMTKIIGGLGEIWRE